MSNFVDQPFRFNEYVAHSPVEAMTKVGIAKQAQYDAGYQKIQQSIDQVAGLELVRDQDKEILQSKLNSLSTELMGAGMSDLSNSQLTNSVSGMVSSLANDPQTLKAVKETQQYKSDSAAEAAANKAGKGGYNNSLIFKKDAEAWLNGPVDAEYNASYMPAVDVRKHAMEVLKNIPGNKMEYDQIDNLQEMILRTKEGGIPSDRIMQALQVGLSPDDMRQLRIDGRANYAGTDQSAFIHSIQSIRDVNTANYDKYIADLEASKTTLSGPKLDAANAKIARLTKEKENIVGKYTSYIESAQSDLEGTKASYHTLNFMQQFSDAFSHSEKSTTYTNIPSYGSGKSKLKQNKTSLVPPGDPNSIYYTGIQLPLSDIEKGKTKGARFMDGYNTEVEQHASAGTEFYLDQMERAGMDMDSLTPEQILARGEKIIQNSIDAYKRGEGNAETLEFAPQYINQKKRLDAKKVKIDKVRKIAKAKREEQVLAEAKKRLEEDPNYFFGAVGGALAPSLAKVVSVAESFTDMSTDTKEVLRQIFIPGVPATALYDTPEELDEEMFLKVMDETDPYMDINDPVGFGIKTSDKEIRGLATTTAQSILQQEAVQKLNPDSAAILGDPNAIYSITVDEGDDLNPESKYFLVGSSKAGTEGITMKLPLSQKQFEQFPSSEALVSSESKRYSDTKVEDIYLSGDSKKSTSTDGGVTTLENSFYSPIDFPNVSLPLNGNLKRNQSGTGYKLELVVKAPTADPGEFEWKTVEYPPVGMEGLPASGYVDKSKIEWMFKNLTNDQVASLYMRTYHPNVTISENTINEFISATKI